MSIAAVDPEAPPVRAAIYTRVSKDKTGDALAVARQRQDCVALAEARGWQVVGEYRDNDLSAYSGRARPR